MAESKTKDEPVDGARLAARILNQYPAEARERLLHAIQEKSPDVIPMIKANLVSLGDIIHLTARSVQLLVKEIDQKDLVLALHSASTDLRSKFFQNMSERKINVVKEELLALKNPIKQEVDAAVQRITKKLDELRTAGLIQAESGEDIWV